MGRRELVLLGQKRACVAWAEASLCCVGRSELVLRGQGGSSGLELCGQRVVWQRVVWAGGCLGSELRGHCSELHGQRVASAHQVTWAACCFGIELLGQWAGGCLGSKLRGQ